MNTREPAVTFGPVDPSLSTGQTSAGTLARELGKQVTRALATAPGESERPPRSRDRRQDSLWDCASVLQYVGRVEETERILDHLKGLPAVLEQSEASDFPDVLGRWTDQAWDFVGGR